MISATTLAVSQLRFALDVYLVLIGRYAVKTKEGPSSIALHFSVVTIISIRRAASHSRTSPGRPVDNKFSECCFVLYPMRDLHSSLKVY